jgi:predicted transport protein
MSIFNPKSISLKNNPEISEKTIQDIIAEDPSIIGLGDLLLKDKERTQPRAGRLDLLMQDPDSNRRYEIELQLGKTDESHIIRCIEYWDIERKRYPQYDHCAVIIAEDITSRFLNVISLFNGHIPLIAIQVNAYKFGNDIGLVFTKVLDEMPLGLIEEDEEIKEVTDRDYWLNRGTKTTVNMVDKMLDLINTFSNGYELKYNKYYIGMAMNGQPNNFVIFKPKKNFLRIEIKLPKSQETDQLFEVNDIDTGYTRWGAYNFNLMKGDIERKREAILTLLTQAYNNFN